jgi:hypothetical protein
MQVGVIGRCSVRTRARAAPQSAICIPGAGASAGAPGSRGGPNSMHPAEEAGVNVRLLEAAGCGAAVLSESGPRCQNCSM